MKELVLASTYAPCMAVKLSQYLELTDWSLSALDRRAKADLPKAYARDSIPSRKDQIPTPEIADKWPHLKKIKEKISPLNESLSVGVLIGSNCPKAIKPREIVAGRSEDPYAVRTLLGWCIVGPSQSP